METTFHYPPELLQLLIEAIPRLCRSKRDVLLFFRGAGVGDAILSPLEGTLSSDPSSINKFELARTALREINERGDSYLRERREVLKRVVEFEDFSTCWPEDQLKAKGLVAEICRVVDVKDSFTRMRIERESEAQRHRKAAAAQSREQQEKRQAREAIKAEFYRLFGESDPHLRGRSLESVLNRLFAAYGLLVRGSFTLRQDASGVPLEQIDGIIELDGHIYLVEMKWLNTPTGKGDVSEHLVRVFAREGTRGLFISASDYSAGALELCKDALAQRVVVLVTLQELVWILENDKTLDAFLRAKVRGTIATKQPFVSVEGEL
jgi:restriction endonuclease Mrr